MAIRFFFHYGKQVIQLPVNPEAITVTIPGNNQSSEIVKLGQINKLKQVGLAQCTIESFFPAKPSGSYVVTSEENFEKPSFYFKFFKEVRAAESPLRLIISGTGINMLMSIEDFDFGYLAQDDDMHFVLKLKQYKNYGSKVMKVDEKTKASPTTKTNPDRQKNGLSIGDTVIVNGNYWYDSYGSKPYGTFKNFEGKISHIVADKNRKYRFHITTPSGGFRGWVTESQIKHK